MAKRKGNPEIRDMDNDGDEDDIKLQQQIPGTESERNAEIEKKAKSYLMKMRSRKAAGELESEAKDSLIIAMAEAGETHYRHGNIVVDVGEKRTLKVKDENSSDE